MPTETYVLLECMDADAPVYQQTADKKRVQVKKIPVHRPTLRQTFQDEKGKSVTIRYKANSNSVFQDVQIKEEKIEANERFTTREYRDPEFKFGILVVPEQKKVLQDYLKAHPECEGFKGLCDDVRQPKYKLLDKVAETKLKNTDMRLRVKAANKVIDSDLETLQSMLIRLNGSFFETPNPKNYEGTEEERIEAAKKDCENMLMEFIDDSEEPGLLAIMKDESATNIDEQTSVLIGKLIGQGTLSFDAVQGKISKKDKNGKWVEIRVMSDEYTLDERMRLFSDFLNTEDGKPLKNDLEKDLKKATKEK